MAADLLPLLLLAGGAAVHELHLPVVVALLLGFAVLRRDARGRGAPWAGSIPVAVSLAWGSLPIPASATDGSTCTSPVAPFATFRVAEALLALGTLAVLLPIVGGGGGEIGLRRPTRRVGRIAAACVLVAGPLGLLLGPVLAEPFFGPVRLRLDDPMAVLPAVAFAVANGTMEEILYRGSLQAWTARRIGIPLAVAGQAVVFGLAHASGPDVGGSPLLLWLAMTGAGVVAGWIVWRTGSLAIPIAVHIGFDIPLYYGNACRIG